MYHHDSNDWMTTGFRDYHQFLSDLRDAITDERSAIIFYQKLYEIAPTEMARYSLKIAIDDEKIHNKQLTFLYRLMTGQDPDVEVKEETFHHFYDGLEKAFIDQVKAFEMYKKMYLSTRCQRVRDLLYSIQHDEIEHATLFNWVHTELR